MENNDNIQWLWPELPEQPISVNPELWALLREFRSLRNRYFCVINSVGVDNDETLPKVSNLFLDLECLFIAEMSNIISVKILE